MSVREAMRQVREQNKRASERHGKNSENKADEALTFLAVNERITAFWNASGTEDRLYGIDRHIQLPDGRVVDLQIKSSRSGVDKAKQKFPHIPVIEVSEDETVESLAMRLLGCIQAKLKGKF